MVANIKQLGNLQLYDPIRGYINKSKKARNGLTISEEYYRIAAINFLIGKGYPKNHFLIEPVIKRFGNSGRNSFRSDLAVLDTPLANIDKTNIDELMKHVLILVEVKRDNAKADYVQHTQVEPMLDFSKKNETVAIYWDPVVQTVFWQSWVKQSDGSSQRHTNNGPLNLVPKYGNKFNVMPLTYADLRPAESLIQVFSEIENILHQASFGPEERYEMILQLLLAKIFDEHAYETRPNIQLDIQDYQSIGLSPSTAYQKFSNVVGRAIRYYQNHLPNPISTKVKMKSDTLVETLKILAPLRIIDSKRDVIQTFYMKFAKQLYKWDLAQYFTPTSITDFLIEIINPDFGETVLDPATGSADFLVSAFRRGRVLNPGFADTVYGIDNSKNAVQIAVLNMVLNGDGKSNIYEDDSLQHISKYENNYDIVTCNPPFGTKIVEKREKVLKQFDLGHEWVIDKKQNRESPTNNLLEEQETGILFSEAVIRLVRPKGRVLIILPNGYLGNTSPKYLALREYILRNLKIATIVSLPRFTFKASGADVSASVIIGERYATPLKSSADIKDYPVAIQMVERLGWEAGNKQGKPIYMRNLATGDIIIDSKTGEPIVVSDFKKVIEGIRTSDAASEFPWLIHNMKVTTQKQSGWSIRSSKIVNDENLTLDPKRYSQKAITNVNRIMNNQHKSLDDLVDVIAEKTDKDGNSVRVHKSQQYEYINISGMQYGEYTTQPMMGWELPDRAKHIAEEGDIYVGKIWGSVSKWIYIGKNIGNLVLTNGTFRLRMKQINEKYLADLLAYFSTESWAVQMRSLARGSDGLAEISQSDLLSIKIPLLSDNERNDLKPYLDQLKAGRVTLRGEVQRLISTRQSTFKDVDQRPSHINLV